MKAIHSGSRLLDRWAGDDRRIASLFKSGGGAELVVVGEGEHVRQAQTIIYKGGRGRRGGRDYDFLLGRLWNHDHLRRRARGDGESGQQDNWGFHGSRA